MCGIFGVVTTASRSDLTTAVERGLASLGHRGPDAARIERLSSDRSACFLGLARLRIIDLSPEADQPMSNEDGSVWVAYNGEIYNFGELRAELERAGHRFRSRTDTEVLVHLYEQVGGDAAALLTRLRGMFAFAIYDAGRGRLLLARDRLGIKPLYLEALEQDGVAFASEARALVASGLATGRPDPEALRGYLAWGVVPGPGTVFEGVSELPPGHFLTWEAGVQHRERWWSPRPEPDLTLAHPHEASRVLGAALEDAVARHVIADRPVGVFLSSGLDSGTVATLAARATGRVRALTITFPDIPGADEGDAAAAAARSIGAEHREVPFTSTGIAPLLPEALRAMDQPTLNAVNTWIVCRAAREEGLVVCLAGLGGDEAFGGYPSFRLVPRLARLESVLHLVPRPIRGGLALALARRSPGSRAARALSGSGGLAGAYAAVRGLFSAALIGRLPLPAAHAGAVGALNVDGLRGPGAVGFLEMTHYLPNQILRDTDAVSMAHSLEVRVPLLDDIVVRTALALPDEVRFAPHKGVLARATGVEGVTTKRPFALPFDRWITAPLRETVRGALLSEELPFADALPAAWRRRIWDAFVAHRIHWSRPWALTVLRLWPAANDLSW